MLCVFEINDNIALAQFFKGNPYMIIKWSREALPELSIMLHLQQGGSDAVQQLEFYSVVTSLEKVKATSSPLSCYFRNVFD